MMIVFKELNLVVCHTQYINVTHYFMSNKTTQPCLGATVIKTALATWLLLTA